jgi:hypothetical protein
VSVRLAAEIGEPSVDVSRDREVLLAQTWNVSFKHDDFDTVLS